MKKFDSKIWVRCPKCNGPGFVQELKQGVVIELGFELSFTQARFLCTGCGHTISNVDKENKIIDNWSGPQEFKLAFSNQCSACGVEGKLEIAQNQKIENGKTELKCTGCGQIRSYSAFMKNKDWFNEGVDKYFGLSLLFQKSIQNELVWILNRNHLIFLKKYLERKIRKQNTIHTDPENRIPEVLILAKNKKEVLTFLARTEETLNKLENVA